MNVYKNPTCFSRWSVRPKLYPDWYGIPHIGFVYRGPWSDPALEYKGKIINSHVIEDTMWERYREYCNERGEIENINGFDSFMRENADDVYELCDLVIGE